MIDFENPIGKPLSEDAWAEELAKDLKEEESKPSPQDAITIEFTREEAAMLVHLQAHTNLELDIKSSARRKLLDALRDTA